MNKESVKILKNPKKESEIIHTNLFDRDILIYALLGLTILIILIARIHLLSIPFERDEGEYAYMGKLILDGHPPYTLAYNMKLPGTYYIYAIIMAIFGRSIVGVHLGLTCIILASVLLVFLISRNFVSKIGSVISAASFGIIGTSWTLLAQAAHATHFVNFFALLGIYFLLQLYKRKKSKVLMYFLSGFFFSFAFICKQSGLFFMLFGIVVILVKEYKSSPLYSLLKNLLLFSVGFLVPVIIMLLYFYIFGDFGKFWFWTITYLSKYAVHVPISNITAMFNEGVKNITNNFSSVGYIALWIISLVGIPFIFINKYKKRNTIIIFSFLFFSFLTILPGFYFRNHYFITLLPAVGLMIAIFFDFFNNFFIQKQKLPNLVFISLFAFIILAGTGIMANKDYLFKVNPNITCKRIYGSNPFVESMEIAKFLEKNTNNDDKIAILGSEPQICFYANRYSATGYIYTYDLVKIHPYALSMQKDMINEIEINKPKYILFIHVSMSWLLKSNSETFIFRWASKYIDNNYKLVGLMDIFPDRISSLKIGEQLINYHPQSEEFIYIYQKI